MDTSLTHTTNYNVEDVRDAVEKLKSKIVQNGDNKEETANKKLDYLNQLAAFDFGQFIIVNRGANGYWTDQILSHYPGKRKLCNEVEAFIFEKSPIALATRDRFNIFQKELQTLLRNNYKLASVPCGLMRDLLTLDYDKINNVSLIGVDIDSESLSLASKFAKRKCPKIATRFLKENAWNLPFSEELDIITSNGLNVYVTDHSKLITLYRKFYKSLKNGGTLIIGAITPPQAWNLQFIPKEDLLLERILFSDILDLKWMNYRTEKEICSDFKEAGFKNIRLIYDQRKIFPTIIATK